MAAPAWGLIVFVNILDEAIVFGTISRLNWLLLSTRVCWLRWVDFDLRLVQPPPSLPPLLSVLKQPWRHPGGRTDRHVCPSRPSSLRVSPPRR